MNLRVPYNAGKFLSDYRIGNFSSRAQLHEWLVWASVVIVKKVYFEVMRDLQLLATPISNGRFIYMTALFICQNICLLYYYCTDCK
jgi:hypothetical protein